jgi:hypothetical protein
VPLIVVMVDHAVLPPGEFIRAVKQIHGFREGGEENHIEKNLGKLNIPLRSLTSWNTGSGKPRTVQCSFVASSVFDF